MSSEANARPASFREFGVALVGEVFSPGFVRRVLDTALESMARRSALLSELGVGIVRVRAGDPTLLEDDGYERRFAVTVRAQLGAEVGPRLLTSSIEAHVEVDLTVRVGTFRPAIVQLDIDPVTPDDVRVRAQPTSEWLKFPSLGGRATSRLSHMAERWLPVICTTVNGALEASAGARRVNVLEKVRQAQGGWAKAVEPVTGTLDAGQGLEWSIHLGDQERAQLQLWAGFDVDPGTVRSTTPTSRSSVELSVSDAAGNPVDQLTLPIIRTVPDFDTTATGEGLTVAATAPGTYRARMVNHTVSPLRYRVEEQRDTVPGDRIGFAEFGEVLVQRGIDRETVSSAISDVLARGPQVLDTPRLVGARAATRLGEVSQESADPDELRFRLSLIIEVELFLGPGRNATVVGSTLEASMSLRVSTMLDPATLLVAFAPVSTEDLRFIEAPHRIRGRRMPIPRRKLAELLPRRVAAELHRELSETSLQLVPSKLAAAAPLLAAGGSPSRPPGPDNDHRERARGLRTLRALSPFRPLTPRALRDRRSFSGMTSAAQPAVHIVELAYRQRIRAEATITGETPEPTDGDGSARTDLAAELAVCDEHGGVRVAEHTQTFREGEPTIVVVEFTAPYGGQWRLRLACPGGTGALNYELEVQPAT